MSNKPTYVLNPYTGRYVSTSGKAFRRLETHGLLGAKPKRGQNVVYEGGDIEDVRAQRPKLRNDDPTKTLRRYGNKIVKVNRKIPRTEYRDKISKAGAAIMKRSLTDSNLAGMSDDEMTDYFKQCLHAEIMKGIPEEEPQEDYEEVYDEQYEEEPK